MGSKYIPSVFTPDELSDISERVSKGADFLDGKIPGWHNAIDGEALEMSEPDTCLLGQLWMQENIFPHTKGDYHTAVINLSDYSMPAARDNWAIEHGFLVYEEKDNLYEEYEVLAVFWMNEVEARLEV